MGFKTVDLRVLSEELGVNYFEVKEKQRLIERIVKLRGDHGLSQIELGKMIGVSQGRIAQIESGVGTSRISFDVIFNIIHALGFNCEVRLRKAA